MHKLLKFRQFFVDYIVSLIDFNFFVYYIGILHTYSILCHLLDKRGAVVGMPWLDLMGTLFAPVVGRKERGGGGGGGGTLHC